MSGRFISFEGGEGAGKTTNITTAAGVLEQHDIPYIVTREPGGTDYAESIREILLNKQRELLQDAAELLLVFAARIQHIEQKIKPALAKGHWVLCDRFTDSSFAYQGYGRGISLADIILLEERFLGGFKPDKTILFDLPVEVGMARAKKRATLDRFEDQHLDFFRKVRDGFLARAGQDSQRFVIVDAEQALGSVSLQVEQAIRHLIAESCS